MLVYINDMPTGCDRSQLQGHGESFPMPWIGKFEQ